MLTLASYKQLHVITGSVAAGSRHHLEGLLLHARLLQNGVKSVQCVSQYMVRANIHLRHKHYLSLPKAIHLVVLHPLHAIDTQLRSKMLLEEPTGFQLKHPHVAR
jgi:hypothetical protein